VYGQVISDEKTKNIIQLSRGKVIYHSALIIKKGIEKKVTTKYI
tara:strand:- start:898 stop:1029 length:132 start_codon:yes stop_codon:yes gene_type:complete